MWNSIYVLRVAFQGLEEGCQRQKMNSYQEKKVPHMVTEKYQSFTSVATSLWTCLKKRHEAVFSCQQRKISCLLNHRTPSEIKVIPCSCHLVTDTFQKSPTLMCDHFFHLLWSSYAWSFLVIELSSRFTGGS